MERRNDERKGRLVEVAVGRSDRQQQYFVDRSLVFVLMVSVGVADGVGS